jgi:hypothetical protein
LIALFLVGFSALAQKTTSADTAETPKTSLSLASIYASDANYYGQTSVDRLPYVLANATLNFPSGFFLSAGAYKLINIGSGVSGIDLSAGFDFKLSKNLSSSLSFSRSFFPDSSLFLQSANLNMASGSLSYDWQWLKTGLYADYAIGDQSALFTTFSASKLFDLGSITAKDYISFEPSVDIIGGTQRITTTEEISENGGGSGEGDLLSKVRRRLIRNNNGAQQYREITSSSFDLLSYNLKLPVAYNRANYAIEATYQGSILSNKVDGASQKPRSFLYLGFYYMF